MKMMMPLAPRTRKRSPDDNDSSSSSAIDSMRPVVAPRKRRKTFLDAFNSITLQKDSDAGDDEEDADSSQAVADDGEGDYLTTSSLEEEEDEVDPFLSDKEEAERKVMLELVLGANATTPQDIVDLKLQAMVRDSLRQAQAAAAASATTQDDMSVETAYSRPTAPAALPAFKRSNSLPNIACDLAEMETDSTTSSS